MVEETRVPDENHWPAANRIEYTSQRAGYPFLMYVYKSYDQLILNLFYFIQSVSEYQDLKKISVYRILGICDFYLTD